MFKDGITKPADTATAQDLLRQTTREHAPAIADALDSGDVTQAARLFLAMTA